MDIQEIMEDSRSVLERYDEEGEIPVDEIGSDRSVSRVGPDT